MESHFRDGDVEMFDERVVVGSWKVLLMGRAKHKDVFLCVQQDAAFLRERSDIVFQICLSLSTKTIDARPRGPLRHKRFVVVKALCTTAVPFGYVRISHRFLIFEISAVRPPTYRPCVQNSASALHHCDPTIDQSTSTSCVIPLLRRSSKSHIEPNNSFGQRHIDGSEAITMLKLISSTPSPYARKVRIVLAEKGIAFELITEVPWESTTQTPQYNPLQKVPVLIFPDGKAIYESRYVLEYLEAKYPDVPLLPKGQDKIDDALFAKQIEVVADGICDALVLSFFEAQRGEEKLSPEWMARQRRKVDGGLKALAEWFGDDDAKQFLVDGTFGLADVAVGSCLGYIKVRFAEHPWRKMYPFLDRYSERLEERQSFRDTVPKPQNFSEKIV